MQKIMKLCDCPKGICRADSPTDTCRFVVDPHDRLRLDITNNFGPVVAKEKKHMMSNFRQNPTRPIPPEVFQNRIADLERQLAEAKAEIEVLKNAYAGARAGRNA